MDIDTARGVAARIWCDPDYEHVIMNPDLAEEIAVILMGEANHQAAQQSVQSDGACLVHYYAGSENGYKCQLCGHEVPPRR